MDRGAVDRVRHQLEAGAAQNLSQPLGADRKPDGEQDLRRLAKSRGTVEQQQIEGEADRCHDEHGRNGDPIDAEQARQHAEAREPHGDIHAGHQKLAVRKVDELHHAEHQVEAHGDQRVDAADQEPIDDRLQKDHGAAPAAVRHPVARLKYIIG
jgi:hypothetical protein